MLKCLIEIKKDLIIILESLNENPLGVAALTGTSFNIDRNYTTKNLVLKNLQIILLIQFQTEILY